MRRFDLVWVALLLAPYASSAGTAAGVQSSTTAHAALTGPDGSARGEAWLSRKAGGVRVRIKALGLPPGMHGVHLHTAGRCELPGFTTAGPHWNPSSRMHGRDNPQGAHTGDLPNLVIGSDGTGTLDYFIADADLAGGASPLIDADGAAIVIHAADDDYRTDPSGNSGARIACGVILPGQA